jgi:hypothetical protein
VLAHVGASVQTVYAWPMGPTLPDPGRVAEKLVARAESYADGLGESGAAFAVWAFYGSSSQPSDVRAFAV